MKLNTTAASLDGSDTWITNLSSPSVCQRHFVLLNDSGSFVDKKN